MDKMTKSSMFFYLILSALNHISGSWAACSRTTLQATADAFFNSAINKSGASSLKISPNVKIVENNIRKKALQDTSHPYIAAFARPFRLNAIDTQACSVASLVVVNMTEQNPAAANAKGTVPNTGDDCKNSGKPATASKSSGKSDNKNNGKSTGKNSGGASSIFTGDATAPTDGKNPWPNLISLRTKIAEGTGEITEIEIVNVGTGKGGNAGTLMQTASMPQDAGPKWSAPLTPKGVTTTPAPNREQLLQILDSYPEGIHRHNGSVVKSADSCQRIENGRRMPYACNAKYEALTQNVTNRDWVVDTETGISLGKFFFERDFSPFWIHEYFKVTDGLIQEIYAAIIPWGCSSFKDNLKS